MLGKLIKHEFKGSSRYVLTIYMCAAATIVITVLAMLTKAAAVATISSVVLYFLGILVVILTLVSVIKNFYDSLYSAQGYLSFTLPVKCSTLLFSKVLVSFIWIILSFLILGIAYFVIAMSAKMRIEGASEGIIQAVRDSGLLDMLPSGKMFFKAAILLVCYALMLILTFVGFVYFSVTIANTRPLQKHPKLFGFLTFFGSYIATTTISKKLSDVVPFSLTFENDDISIVFRAISEQEEALFSIGLAGIVFMAVVALVMLCVTGYIMENKVNVK